MANDFSGDPNCVALWKFDNDGKGGNDLTEVGSPSYDSGDKKEGTHCIDLEKDSTQYCTIADGDLDTGFPGKSGTSEQSFSVCCWIKPESLGSWQGIISKFSASYKTFLLRLWSAGTVDFIIAYSGGTTSLKFDTDLSTGIWYHIGITYDASDNSMKIRVWDDNAGALLDSNKEGTAGGDMAPNAGALEVGRFYETDADTFDGKIDEVVFFKDVLSDAEIDQIRAGAYGASVSEKNAADTGSGAEASLSSVVLDDTESGSGIDAVESLQTPQAKTSSETGSGADILSQVQAILDGAESGDGVDAVESLQAPQAKTSSDSGTGAEASLSSASLAGTESGAGVEASLSSATLAGSESGSGLEALIARLLAGEEDGGAVEVSSLDTEGGLENLFADELGEGADCLVAKIATPTKGGGMRLWT